MRLPVRRTSHDSEQYVLPLVNVVLLLLIFFMLAGSVTQVDTLDIEPPRSESGRPAEQDKTLIVLLAADGRLAVADRTLDLEGLRRVVRGHLADNEAGAVRLKADAGTEARHLLRVVGVLREAGAEKITLLTAQPD